MSRLTAGICLSLETLKIAKGPQSRAPSAHPLGFFLSSARDSQLTMLCRCCLFLRFLCVSLLVRCLYASILSTLLFADIVYFCVFSVFRFWRSACMLRYLMRYAVPMRHTAISRSESQVRGGRLLVVTLAEPP